MTEASSLTRTFMLAGSLFLLTTGDAIAQGGAATQVPTQARSTVGDRHSGEARIIVARDDDWDYASPTEAEAPSPLSKYGRTDWSATDWLEEDLPEVHGLVIGSLSDEISMAQFNEQRGGSDEEPRYKRLDPKPGQVAAHLRKHPQINVLLVMHHSSSDTVAFSEADRRAILTVLERGGRLLIADDWGGLRPLSDAVADWLNGGDWDRPQPLAAGQGDASDSEAKLTPVEREVKQLIKQLRDRDWHEREQAEQQLKSLADNPAYREPLEKIYADASDPDLTWRLEQVLGQSSPSQSRPTRRDGLRMDEDVQEFLAAIEDAPVHIESVKIRCNIKAIEDDAARVIVRLKPPAQVDPATAEPASD